MRNLRGIDGTLAGLADQTGSVVLQLRNLRGDIVATVPNTSGATGVTGYFESSEFGVPRTPAGTRTAPLPSPTGGHIAEA